MRKRYLARLFTRYLKVPSHNLDKETTKVKCWKFKPPTCPFSSKASMNNITTWLFFFFLIAFQGHTHGTWKFPGQGSNQSCSCRRATATPDLSCICDLHHSSRQRWILNPLIEARDWTCVLMDTSWVPYHWATMGTPLLSICKAF